MLYHTAVYARMHRTVLIYMLVFSFVLPIENRPARPSEPQGSNATLHSAMFCAWRVWFTPKGLPGIWHIP